MAGLMLNLMLILDVQVCSSKTDTPYLVSPHGTLEHNKYVVLKMPVCVTKRANGGPEVGRCYCVRYMCGTTQERRFAQFCYLGVIDQQLIFIDGHPVAEAGPQSSLFRDAAYRNDFNFRVI